MPHAPHDRDKTARELFLEQAAAYFDEMKTVANNAPYGQTFDQIETFAFVQGRELLRKSIESMLQEQIDKVEKKMTRRSVRNVKRNAAIGATTRSPDSVFSVKLPFQDSIGNVSLVACRNVLRMLRSVWKVAIPLACVD
jgi:uncharacterized iron-regulated protein